jgi:hypothetical protein
VLIVGQEERILNVLKEAQDRLWLRELARRCNMNPGLVLYYVRTKLKDLVDVEKVPTVGQKDLVYISLKEP